MNLANYDQSLNLRDGSWHMVTMTFENGSQKLYADAVLLDTFTYSGPLPSNSTSVVIGGMNFGPYHHPWLGDIDEVLIYNRALSGSEVKAIFDGTGCADGFANVIIGSGANFMKVCVSDQGNLVQFESPAGFPHIGLGEQYEGYFLCSLGGSTLHGYDAGLTESGFGPSAITAQPNGPNTFPLTITRTTLDGVFELTQKFSLGNPKKQIIIGMTVKNVSAAAVENVTLGRYFNGNIDGDADDDLYARVADSVWGWEDGSGHGLMQSALTLSTPHSTLVESFPDWDGATAAACGGAPQTTPTAPGDFVGRLTYNLGKIKAGKSTTVEVLYRRF